MVVCVSICERSLVCKKWQCLSGSEKFIVRSGSNSNAFYLCRRNEWGLAEGNPHRAVAYAIYSGFR